ncbi:hypothetical protein V6L78_01900 [Pseudomonas canadensis]|uniref:hypothetical protein n=1 Tax=Pseudomonas canadensis TaxID=915099 RepID=UPI0030CB2B47
MQGKRPLAGKNPALKLPANYTEKGEIAVLNAPVCIMKMRDQFEECGDSFALLVALLTTDLQLTQRARLALIDYGVAQLNGFEKAEEMLRNYVEETTPS